MPEPYVREIGRVVDIDDVPLSVGVDYDAVTFAGWKFTGEQQEEFGRLFIAACWAAGCNKARMEEEASEAVAETIDMLRARLGVSDDA